MDTTQNKSTEYNLCTKLQKVDSSNLATIEAQLSPPNHEECVILDLENLSEKQTVLWFRKVRTLFKQYRYHIVGVYNAGINLEHAKAASFNSLDGVFNQQKEPADESEIEQIVTPAVYNEPAIYRSNIRSGQRVYHNEDIIILGNVNPGSEVITNGNIHIYGLLAGRALAGVDNNTNAMIFSQILSAELVAINGHYHSSEEMTTSRRCNYISLVNDKLTYNQI